MQAKGEMVADGKYRKFDVVDILRGPSVDTWVLKPARRGGKKIAMRARKFTALVRNHEENEPVEHILYESNRQFQRELPADLVKMFLVKKKHLTPPPLPRGFSVSAKCALNLFVFHADR